VVQKPDPYYIIKNQQILVNINNNFGRENLQKVSNVHIGSCSSVCVSVCPIR